MLYATREQNTSHEHLLYIEEGCLLIRCFNKIQTLTEFLFLSMRAFQYYARSVYISPARNHRKNNKNNPHLLSHRRVNSLVYENVCGNLCA